MAEPQGTIHTHTESSKLQDTCATNQCWSFLCKSYLYMLQLFWLWEALQWEAIKLPPLRCKTNSHRLKTSKSPSSRLMWQLRPALSTRQDYESVTLTDKCVTVNEEASFHLLSLADNRVGEWTADGRKPGPDTQILLCVWACVCVCCQMTHTYGNPQFVSCHHWLANSVQLQPETEQQQHSLKVLH